MAAIAKHMLRVVLVGMSLVSSNPLQAGPFAACTKKPTETLHMHTAFPASPTAHTEDRTFIAFSSASAGCATLLCQVDVRCESSFSQTVPSRPAALHTSVTASRTKQLAICMDDPKP